MKNLRRSTEAEVIAEFLKNEFYHEEFHADRESFERLVLEADLANKDENASAARSVVPPPRPHVARGSRPIPSGGRWNWSPAISSSFEFFRERSGARLQTKVFSFVTL